MNVSALISKFRRFADENSPVILTGMAVSGAFVSVYLTAKGAFKAAETIREANPDGQRVLPNGDVVDYDLSTQEKFLLTYKFYAPAAATLLGTSACMVMATKIGLDRTAAMAGALVVTERTYDQYKDKVRETLGEAKHTKVVDAVATDAVNAAPHNPMLIVGEGEQYCFDVWSGRMFKSKMENLERAVNELNADMLIDDTASLSDYYDRVGLDHIQESDNIGWRSDYLLKPKYTSVLHDNKPCIAITFDPIPTARFQNAHG